MADDASNALGLDFSQLTVADKQEPVQEPNAVEENDTTTTTTKKEKGKPYVNPERVKTGGAQRDKLSDEALQERMARIKEQNERIKQRRLDVQADEDAFRKTQEIEREKQAQNRRVQSDVDRARDQNAKRKMDKVQSREWDSGKPSLDRRGQQPNRLDPPPPQSESQGAEATPNWANTPAQENVDSGSWTRAGNPPSHRSRGRGRGRGGNHAIHRDSGTPTSGRDAPDTANNSSPPAT